MYIISSTLCLKSIFFGRSVHNNKYFVCLKSILVLLEVDHYVERTNPTFKANIKRAACTSTSTSTNDVDKI